MPGGGLLGAIPGWVSGSMLFEPTSLLDSWDLPREWGDAPQHAYGPLTGFTKDRGIVLFKKKKKELYAVPATVGWTLL